MATTVKKGTKKEAVKLANDMNLTTVSFSKKDAYSASNNYQSVEYRGGKITVKDASI